MKRNLNDWIQQVMKKNSKIICEYEEDNMIDGNTVNWIDSLPDKLLLPCSICGCRVDFDYIVDDFLWNEVVPKQHKLNVVCLNCLDVLATEKGENVCEHIKRMFYCGEEKTMTLFCGPTFHYQKLNIHKITI